MTNESDQLRVSDFTMAHFAAHPVWTWADEDDESLVIPAEISVALPENHGGFFVASRFVLATGGELQGFVAVRSVDRMVYLVSFARPDGKLLDLPFNRYYGHYRISKC